MSIDDLMCLLQHPQEVKSEHVAELREVLEYAPYCAPLRILYLKALHVADNLHYPHEQKKTVLYAESPAFLSSVILMEDVEPKKKIRQNRYTGSYFDLVEQVEKGDTNVTSLKELAERLRTAREGMQQERLSKEPVKIVVQEIPEFTEEHLKQAVKDGLYEQAIVILKQLNLNNQKKISYFADQMRFLEKIVENAKGLDKSDNVIN